MSSSPPLSARQGGNRPHPPIHPRSQQQHPQMHSHDHNTAHPMLHPHHPPAPVAFEPPVKTIPVAFEPPVKTTPVTFESPVKTTPVAYEPPVKTTASALSSPFMSISIANKAASIPKSSSQGPTLDKWITSQKDFTPQQPQQQHIHHHTKHSSTDSDSKEQAIPAPSYESSVANIPTLDPLPPPPVYDIVNCSTSQTLLLVSSLINTILAVNDRLQCPKITLFHSRAIPNISIEAYLTRILQYAPFQNEVLLIILLYFDRIGGGCKPTQVLTNNIPKPLLLKAFHSEKNPFSAQQQPGDPTLPCPIPSHVPDKSPIATTSTTAPERDPRLLDELMKDGGAETDKESAKAAVIKQAKALEAKCQQRRCKPPMPGSNLGPNSQVPEEEEPIEDEIYTSSAESPIGSKLIINSFNIHRLLITSILVASKFSSDVFYPNVRYARVGGLPLSELNQLELEFLFLSQFELNATESELQAYGNKLLMYQQRLASEKKLPSLVPDVTKQTNPFTPPPQFSYTPADVKEKPAPESPVVRRPSMVETTTTTATDVSTKPPVVCAPVPTRPIPMHGSYRDSKEGIRQDDEDDDDSMSQRGREDSLMSPTESDVDMSVLKDSRPPVESTAPPPRTYTRHHVMNLDSLVWPTNHTEDHHPSTNYFFGSMVKDEDAERIEQEFNRPSPPLPSLEAQEHQKRKLQRLSSGSMETTPSKRVNPAKKASKESRLSSSSSASSSSSNILKPFFRKIASLAHRSEPQAEEHTEPEPHSLRTHPYMVRPRVSPPPPVLPEPTTTTDPAVRSGAGPSQWQTGPSSTTQGTPWTLQRSAPPPYSGKAPSLPTATPLEPSSSKPSSQSRNRPTRDYRRHRSREPSISTLASELTFEPTRSNKSPYAEEEEEEEEEYDNHRVEMHKARSNPATLAPFYFPSRPQTIDGMHHSGPSRRQSIATCSIAEEESMDQDMPMAAADASTRKGFRPMTFQEQNTTSMDSMEVDEESRPAFQRDPRTDKTGSRNQVPASAANSATASKVQQPPGPATPAKSCASSRRSSVSSSTTDAKEQASSTAGRQWKSSHGPTTAPPFTTTTPSPHPGVVVVAAAGPPPQMPQVYHSPHHAPYVASYYAPPPTLAHANNIQLYHDPVTMKTFPIMAHPHQSVLVAMPPMSMAPVAATAAAVSAHPAVAHSSAAAVTASQSRPNKTTRQFASIRPRTPTAMAATAAAQAQATPTAGSLAPSSNSDDKSVPTAKSSRRTLFGSSKKPAVARPPPPPPPSRPPPSLPFMAAAAAAPGFGRHPPPPMMAFAPPPTPHGAASGAPPILIPLIPVMYNNVVRPCAPPPLPTNPPPPTLVKIAPKLPLGVK